MTKAAVKALVPMAFVAEIARSIDYYGKLGFEVQGTNTPPGETELSWASLTAGGAQLMVARASYPVDPAAQAVLFYIYCEDVAAMHSSLAAAGLHPGAITRPFYNPGGEFRLTDPDGYVILVTHV